MRTRLVQCLDLVLQVQPNVVALPQRQVALPRARCGPMRRASHASRLTHASRPTDADAKRLIRFRPRLQSMQNQGSLLPIPQLKSRILPADFFHRAKRRTESQPQSSAGAPAAGREQGGAGRSGAEQGGAGRGRAEQGERDR